MSNTKQYDNYADLITFTRASTGTALRHVGYGAELITNGTFDTDSDWTKGASWTISGGEATMSSTSSYSPLTQNLTLVAGRTYKVDFTVTAISGSMAVAFRSGTTVISNGGVPEAFTTTGQKSFNLFVPSGAADTITFSRSSGTASVTIDNVSVKEVIFDRASDPLVLFNHPTNVPRIEYDADGNRKGLLIEEARTNLLVQSGDLGVSPWTAINVTTSVDASTAPDGGDMTLLTSTGVNSDTAVIQNTTSSAGTTYTASFFVRRDQHRFAILFGFGNGGTGVAFDLVLGTAQVNGSWVSAGIDIISPTIARIYGVVTPVLSNAGLYVGLASTINGDKFFSGGEALSFWGAQLEAGSFPTSYIPTAGAAASRSADVASIPTSAFGYNQKAGTVVVDVNHPLENRELGRKYIFNVDDIGNDRLALRASDFPIVEPRAVIGNGTSNIDFVSPVTTSATYVVGLSYDNVGATMAVDGSLAAQTNSYAGNPQTLLEIGNTSAGQFLSGHIKSLSYFPRRLSNAQLVRLTS